MSVIGSPISDFGADPVAKELNFDQLTEDGEVKCLISKKLVDDNQHQASCDDRRLLTPETPPFTGMKCVFGSAGSAGADEEAKVAFRAPESGFRGINQAEEDDMMRFATLEAAQPTHIIESTNGPQSGRLHYQYPMQNNEGCEDNE